MTANARIAWAVGLAVLVALPFVYRDPYHLHLLIIILIWSFAYTSWSMMGRFGLVSLGHGGFMGVGAYVTALLWNHAGLTPWIGIPVALLCLLIWKYTAQEKSEDDEEAPAAAPGKAAT